MMRAFMSSNSKRSTSSIGSSSVSPGLFDAHLAQHLADDDLDVLVVDVHTLGPVDLLDLVDQVALHRLAALDAQDVLRVRRALGEEVAGARPPAVLDAEPGGVRDRVLALLRSFDGDRDPANSCTLTVPDDRRGHVASCPWLRRSGLAIGVPATTSAPSSTAST